MMLLAEVSRILRARTILNAHRTGTPHLGSCLSCMDVLVAAYFHALRIDPRQPRSPSRDRFILSKGHGAPALFQVLAMRGFYPQSRLASYGQDGSVFAEHPPAPDYLEGVEAATGSLGHGLPIALGMALAGRVNNAPYKVIALLSDGECNEGSVWEAAMLAGAQRVENLCAVIDYNKWQATGRSEEVMALAPLADKWRAFGWSVREIDGHDLASLGEQLTRVPDGSGKPVALVAHTVKGKGVSFMEDDNNWHYRIPNAEDVARALRELDVSRETLQ
ncbi:MAG: transketolase [Burkholderiales bacterium]